MAVTGIEEVRAEGNLCGGQRGQTPSVGGGAEYG